MCEAFVSHAEGLVLETQSRQTLLFKTCIDSSAAERGTTVVSVTGPWR